MLLKTSNIYYIFITCHKTPNPNYLKFIPTNQIVIGTLNPIHFKNIYETNSISPLARKLFKINGITEIFYGSNYISIAKQTSANWNQLKPMIFDQIQHHYESGQDLILQKQEINIHCIDDNQITKIIKEILMNRIRPNIQDDGGDIQFISFNENNGILKLKMMGSCSGCPSSTNTLKNGILKMMKHYVSQVKDVIAIEQQ